MADVVSKCLVIPYDSGNVTILVRPVPNQVDNFLNLGKVSSLAAGENVSSTLLSALLNPSQKKHHTLNAIVEGFSTRTKHFQDYKNSVKAGILSPTTANHSNPNLGDCEPENPVDVSQEGLDDEDLTFLNYLSNLYNKLSKEKQITAQILITTLIKLSCSEN